MSMEDMSKQSVAAVVLAAGRSLRMGRPKMVLPWGGATVIGQVVGVLRQAEIQNIVVVTGGARRQVEAALVGYAVQLVFNPRFAQVEMLVSLQLGLLNLGSDVDAALVVLGDQPQIELEVVESVLARYQARQAPLVVPSFQMRRGHPWLVERKLWNDIFELQPASTLRDFLNRYADQIDYLNVVTPSVLRDLDTPQEYQRQRPPNSRRES
jgi:molybdenum cofactor cytidylyltransferase